MPGGGREVQQGVRALGRAVWVDGLDRAPFPVGAGGDEGGSRTEDPVFYYLEDSFKPI